MSFPPGTALDPYGRPMSTDEADPEGGLDARQLRFLKLLSGTYRLLHATVLASVSRPEDADDVMQEVCVVLWANFDDFEPGTNFRRWASAVAHNVTRGFLRRRRRQRAAVLDDETLVELWRTRSGLTELLELRRERLEECLERLGDLDRGIVREFYGGVPAAEIGERTGRSVHTIYDRLKKVRKRLYDCVNRKLGLDR